MKLILGGALAALLLTACDVPQLLAPKATTPPCVQSFMTQMVTTKIVPGAYECLAPSLQEGIGTARGMADFAKSDPIVHDYRLIGRGYLGEFFFTLHTNQGVWFVLLGLDDKSRVVAVKMSKG